MISINVKYYCYEDPSLIENYDKAVNDTNKVWEIHHRLETEEGISAAELKKQNRYFNRPARELIFLTPSEHMRLHTQGRTLPEETIKKMSKSNKGKNKGRKHSFESKHNMSIGQNKYYETHAGHFSRHVHSKETRTLLSKQQKNRKMMTNGIHRTYVKPEEFKLYLDNGYHFGSK